MVDSLITDLPACSSVADADIMVVVQGGTTKQAAVSLVRPTVPLSTVVNVLDYWDAGDDTSTIDGHTTRDIIPSIQRAYDASVKVYKHLVLWVPPCDTYGVDAWSMLGSFAPNVYSTGDNVIYLELRFSGAAGKVIPNAATMNTKIAIAAAGPESMPMHFKVSGLFLCGTGAADDVDCIEFMTTGADMLVRLEECIFYGMLVSGEHLLGLSCMGLEMDRVYFHGCGNTSNASLVSIYGGLHGISLKETNVYKWERDVLPFGESSPGAYLDKMGYDPSQYCPFLWLRGDVEENAPRVDVEQCTFSHAGLLGAINADPTADGFYISSIDIDQCYFTQFCRYAVHAVLNVGEVTIRQSRLSHNDGGQDSVKLFDSSSPRLTMIDNVLANSGIRIRAKTGQKAVYIRGNTGDSDSNGGNYDFSGATNVTIDASTTWDAYADSGTAAPAARVPETHIVKSDATDLTLTADLYIYDMLRITGTPGGAFNIIGPNVARTRFTVVNQTASACTIKKTAGTGVVVAANKSAQAYHDGSDYIRLTPDA